MEKTKVIPVLYCYPKQISLAQQKMKIYPNKQKKKSEGKSLIFSFRHRITNIGVLLRTRGEKNGRKFSRFTLHFHLTEEGGWPQKSNIGQFGLDKLWDIFACARNSGPDPTTEISFHS